MKQCQRCKQEKPLDAFNNNKREKDGKQRTCRECTKKEHQKWYSENKEVQLEKNKAVIKRKYDRFREYKKTLKCTKCNDDRWWLLDFHHLDPTKKDGLISDMVNGSQKRLYEEIAKCIPLCRNCHTDFHYWEKEKNINIEDYLN